LVADDLAHQRGILGWTSESRRKRHHLAERLGDIRRNLSHHRRLEDAWRDGHYANAEARELACDGKGHADDARFGCAVGGLADLTIERGDGRGVNDDAALAAGGGRVLRHPLGYEPGHVERPDQIDVYHAREARERMNAFLTQDPLAMHHTRTIDEAVDLA